MVSAVLVASSLVGCASAPERPASSTLGCAKAVVATLPTGLTDPEKHCLGSAGIALQCSPFEAWLAGWGKEARDALGDGDAAREDLEANRLGRQCAEKPGDAGGMLECCRRRLGVPGD
jgi:hypothetical protein